MDALELVSNIGRNTHRVPTVIPNRLRDPFCLIRIDVIDRYPRPAADSVCAIAAPIPCPAPVTIATRSLSGNVIELNLLLIICVNDRRKGKVRQQWV